MTKSSTSAPPPPPEFSKAPAPPEFSKAPPTTPPKPQTSPRAFAERCVTISNTGDGLSLQIGAPGRLTSTVIRPADWPTGNAARERLIEIVAGIIEGYEHDG